MTDPSSTNDLLARIRAGEKQASTDVFDGYLSRLTALVRTRIADRLSARFDPEDVVLSAYRSFFVANQNGRINAETHHDLWRVLVTFTLRKLSRQVERNIADKRTVHQETSGLMESILSQEPEVAHVVAVADELEHLYRKLSERDREIVELRLQGYQQLEIAEIVGTSERTVRRILHDIQAQFHDGSSTTFSQYVEESQLPQVEIPPTLPKVMITELRIEEMLGAGGMGRVYRAWHFPTKSFVAVKFLRKRYLENKKFVARFLSEASTLLSIEAIGIIRCLGVGTVGSRGLFFTMQLINGPNLSTYCEDHRVSPAQAVNWCLQVAKAVGIAHDRGIIHCDLKPDNLLLDEQGNIHITDFGLATHTDEMTPASAMFGTAPFMAPEQISTHWGSIGKPSDVYGLGTVLYTLLTGQPPYMGKTVPDILAQVVGPQMPTLPSKFRTDLNKELTELCMDCLSKHSGSRISTMSELENRLRKA